MVHTEKWKIWWLILENRYCYHMKVFKSNSQEELVTFIITFLRNTQYIKNPYLKAKLVEVKMRYKGTHERWWLIVLMYSDSILLHLSNCQRRPWRTRDNAQFTSSCPGSLDGVIDDFLCWWVTSKHYSGAVQHFLIVLLLTEVEQTGTSSQFYDKFNIRYNISHIMKTIWGHPAHRAKLREESKYVSFIWIHFHFDWHLT